MTLGPGRFMMEIDSTFKKKKNRFYKIVLRLFLRILAHSFDFPYDVGRNCLASLVIIYIHKYIHKYIYYSFIFIKILIEKHKLTVQLVAIYNYYLY